MAKRPDGSLEHDVMAVLWASNRALTPAEVKMRLDCELAYNSVATILIRLHTKGLVRRSEAGRAFGYEAALDEAHMAARRIDDVLSSVSNRRAAIAGFVESLTNADAAALRALLEGREG